jgi:hypothetical protein
MNFPPYYKCQTRVKKVVSPCLSWANINRF